MSLQNHFFCKAFSPPGWLTKVGEDLHLNTTLSSPGVREAVEEKWTLHVTADVICVFSHQFPPKHLKEEVIHFQCYHQPQKGMLRANILSCRNQQ